MGSEMCIRDSGNIVETDQLTADQAAVELGRGADFLNGCITSSAIGLRIHGYPSAITEAPFRVVGNSVSSLDVSFTATAPFTHGIAFNNNVASNGVSTALLDANANAEQPGPLDGRCPNH